MINSTIANDGELREHARQEWPEVLIVVKGRDISIAGVAIR